MMTEEMTKTVFGEVIIEFLEARDMLARRAYVRGLLEGVDVDASGMLERIEDPYAPHPGEEAMAVLSDRLELSRWERKALAFAFAYEQRCPKTPEIPELTREQDNTLLSAIRRVGAINTAIATVEDNPSPSTRVQAETLDELRMLSEEAESHVMGLKRQYRFKDY